MYDKEDDARTGILNALNMLNTVNTEQQNSMIIPFFFQGKYQELSRVFVHAPPDQKARALDLLSRLDASNVNRYKQDLQ